MEANVPVKKEVKQEVKQELKKEPNEDNVHTVLLRNIPMVEEEQVGNIIPIVYQDANSDGNLQINSTESGNVIHTYIIDNGTEYVESSDGTHIIMEEEGEVSLTEEDINEMEVEEDQPEYVLGTEADDLVEEETVEGNQYEYQDEYEFQLNQEEEEQANETADDVDDEFEENGCDICGKTFKTSAGLKRHITVNHGDDNDQEEEDPLTLQLCICCGEPSDSAHTIGDFKCDECEQLFQQEKFLQRHRSLEHPALPDKFTCVECFKTYTTKEQYADHLRIHPLKSVKCDGCGREFSRKYHLIRHLGQTGCLGQPRQAFQCRVCKRFFTRKDNLAEHLRIHAGHAKKKKALTCQHCNKEFNGAALLNIHIRTHTGEKPYACDLCEKRFPSGGAMKKHRRKHTGEKPYSCSKCGRKFAAKETLNRHMRTHTGEKPHSCQFCGKSFIQASQLRAHIFHHTGENAYICPHCGRAFNRKLRLTTHIKFMHEMADPLPCPDCDKTFFRKEDLQRHSFSHTGIKPFKCEECGKAFSAKSSVRIHQLTHRKEPPCSCETCGRAFIRQDCLMRHIRARHRDVLEDILANAEKKRLQQQLLTAASDAAVKSTLSENVVWNELTLTESIKELLTLLVDEECLTEFGYPDAPVDKVLDSVIKKCGHDPASEEDFDYIGRMRENAKLLFTVVIDDEAVKELLNNQTVDEVILHVLRLARKENEVADGNDSS